MSSDQVARDMTLWRGSNDLHNGNLLALPVGGGEILYLEPIYSQRKDQASAFPKLLRVLVSYKGRVGYAPTVDAALEQVGINSDAVQDIEVVDDGGDTSTDEQPVDEAPADEEETPAAPLPENADEALNSINDALTGLEDARDGSHEEYGRALDELDRAVQRFQDLQDSAEQPAE